MAMLNNQMVLLQFILENNEKTFRLRLDVMSWILNEATLPLLVGFTFNQDIVASRLLPQLARQQNSMLQNNNQAPIGPTKCRKAFDHRKAARTAPNASSATRPSVQRRDVLGLIYHQEPGSPSGKLT